MIDLPDLKNPYNGLRAFGEVDANDFFGRDTLFLALLTRMAEESDLSRFLAVVGPSGSGKSSVVKAGLIPTLRQGGLPGSEKWFLVEMTPGTHPLEELETALLRVAVNPPDSLLTQLREDERGLLRAVRRILPADEDIELVLVIDQFEEIFTLVEDEQVRATCLIAWSLPCLTRAAGCAWLSPREPTSRTVRCNMLILASWFVSKPICLP
jgi:hypothetical protein